MELCLKITAGLLLFVHLASLQETTDSPGRTIDKSWLRKLYKEIAGSQNATVNEDDITAMDSSSGTTSGFMAVNAEEEQSVVTSSLAESRTSEESGFPSTTDSPTTTPSVPINPSQVNTAKNENSTVTPTTSTVDWITNNSTTFPYLANGTELQSTTAPHNNATQEPATKSISSTQSNRTTAVRSTATPEANVTSTAVSSSTAIPPVTTQASTASVTSTVVNTPVKANKTDKDAAVGSSSERGFASDPPRNKRYAAWAAVLGTMVAVIVVGLVVYIVLKSRRDKGFSHRKLVEEYPSDPVLRLDNSEPLDLNFSGSAHHNRGLQGDNIQMTNLPGRH